MTEENERYTLGFLNLLHMSGKTELELINHGLSVLEKIYEFKGKGWKVGFLSSDDKMFREMKFMDNEE